MPRRLLEIASNSVASALAAQAGGADRIELFDNLAEGGTTPSFGSIALARERLTIPLFVLIRARPGDFLYSADETQIMLRDIENCRLLGCDGVVIGALDADGEVDIALCTALVAAAGPMQVTFHRAFDAARDLPQALEQVIALGCQRVLSSGGQASAEAGADMLAALVAQAGGRIGVMAGAGLNAGNIASVATRSGCHELHASAKATRQSTMRHHNPALPGLSPDWTATDAAEVAALRAALDG
ncbi:copper homeostasis protein CutC [Stenotrophomonas rhizophila]|uniref:copper homeostasis protein CutC n=1 Tax=Stenotrophomonas rhizophila TaxID=216778 RepID=UPI001E566F1A|nr:copper homeostasis protein CutC [Stenotrophomonas rhizophila]MCC7633454.1 copper homeostasis protein CutC [Stenotrophomonas rhizophila]MCC7663061.1 copper homeostasis protein CutC [Stenotrophomonas rhizophila]